MDNKQIQNDEYSLQYYKVNAPIVMQKFFNALMLTVGENMDASEEEFALVYPKERVKEVFTNLRKEYLKNINDIMNDKEKELRDLLLIPSNILLPEDKCYAKVYTEDDVSKLSDEIDRLEKLYLEKKERKCDLENELKVFDKLLASYSDVNEVVSKVKGCEEDLEKSKATSKKLFDDYDNHVNDLMEALDLDVEELKF